HAEKSRKPRRTPDDAPARRHRVEFSDLPAPPFTGRRTVSPDLAELVRYIDWTFFFRVWDLKGRFPAILEQPPARELYDDARELLDELLSNTLLHGRAVYGYWPARDEGDDSVLADGRA